MGTKLFFLLMLCASFCFGQSKIDLKNNIRKLNNINIPDAQAKKIENPKVTEKLTEDVSKIELPDGDESDYSVTFINPYAIPVNLAYSTSDIMRVVTIEPNSWWSGVANDYWQNVIIRTNGKDLKYSVRTNHCYKMDITKSGNWDIKSVSCDMYTKAKGTAF